MSTRNERIGTTEIAELREVSRQTASRWCAAGWLKTARQVWVGRRWGWTADLDEVLEFVPPRPGPKAASVAEKQV